MKASPLRCTYVCPINIALVKYWGKRDENLNLPANSSLSITLDVDKLYTTTTVELVPNSDKSEIFLAIGGRQVPLSQAKRIQRVIFEAHKKGLSCGVRIHSSNSFPANVGLASSSSAFSALALCLGHLLHLSPRDVCFLSRIGSGSACRSLYGGFVEWVSGKSPTGSDCLSQQVFDHNHWPDMRVVVVQVSSEPKHIPSSEGMRASFATSDLLWVRNACGLSESRIEGLKNAVREKDFQGFSKIVMKESNTLHAICLDTYPPIIPPYLSSASHRIMKFVECLNKVEGRMLCCYSFDAGPNAFIFVLAPDLGLLLRQFYRNFVPSYVGRMAGHQSSVQQLGCQPLHSLAQALGLSLSDKDPPDLGLPFNCPLDVEGIYVSKVGSGPILVQT